MDKQALKFRGCAACSAGRTGNKGYSEGFFDRSNKNSSTKKPGSARVSPSSCPSLITEYRGSVRVALRKLSAGSSATIHESRWQCDVDIKMSTTLPALTAPCRTRYLSYKVFSAPLILNRILTVYKWGGLLSQFKVNFSRQLIRLICCLSTLVRALFTIERQVIFHEFLSEILTCLFRAHIFN